MIRPSKHAHPDKTVVSSSTILLQRLKKRRSESFDDLRRFHSKRDADIDSLFLPAINLLFLLGLVVYRRQNDTFEYVGR
ncbi:MAG: ABC-three component system middle component 8 [Candidatus Paceibacterota bacterium]